MQKLFGLLTLVLLAVSAGAQTAKPNHFNRKQLGLKAGYNWSYITASGSGFSPNTKSGFMAGAFFAPAPRHGKGFRTELVFSRQGYSFDNGGKNTEVLNDYVYLPQLSTFTLGKFLQLQLGGQIGFLLNSKLSGLKDSTITGLMNRVDYGFAGGVELRPFKGMLIGGRYNLGLGKLYRKFEETATNPYPLPFNPEKTNMKNGVVQFFVGYAF